MNPKNHYLNLITSLAKEGSTENISKDEEFDIPDEYLEDYYEVYGTQCYCCGDEDASKLKFRNANLVPQGGFDKADLVGLFVICDSCWETIKKHIPPITTFYAFALLARRIRHDVEPFSLYDDNEDYEFFESLNEDEFGNFINVITYKGKCQCCKSPSDKVNEWDLYDLCSIDYISKSYRFKIEICDSCKDKLVKILPNYVKFLNLYVLLTVLRTSEYFKPGTFKKIPRHYESGLSLSIEMFDVKDVDRHICHCCGDRKKEVVSRDIYNNLRKRTERVLRGSEIYLPLCQSCWEDLRNELPIIIESLSFRLVFRKFDPIKFIDRL